MACEPGAYQDSHFIFRLLLNKRSTLAKEVHINELYFDDSWKQKVADKTTGYISLEKDKNEFIVTRRYVGAWTCGYAARYSLSDLLKVRLFIF